MPIIDRVPNVVEAQAAGSFGVAPPPPPPVIVSTPGPVTGIQTTNFAMTHDGFYSATISWDATPYATAYNFQLTDASGDPMGPPQQVASNAIVLPGTVIGESYNFRIQACN